MSQSQKIYQAIANVSKKAGALAPEQKGGVPFAFRGVDATVSHLAPHLREEGVVVVPEVLEATHVSRDVLKPNGEPSGKVITQTELRTRFTFYSIEDGSSVSTVTAGLAQDFSDRSAAQAQSVAFRVALLQTFTLPTNEKEPEERGEEIIKGRAEVAAMGPSASAKPAGPTVASLTGQIGEIVAGTYTDSQGTVHDPVSKDRINELGEKFSGKPGTAWRRDLGVLQKIIQEVAK